MKKNIAMRVASLVLMCTIVTSCFVSSTFAKYTSTASGSDSVTVAKWEFTVGETDITASNTVTFNLFKTIGNTYNATEDDTNVADIRGNKKLIAPGTGGSFSLDITNASEVRAGYTVDLSVTNVDSIPLEFSTDGQTWESDIDDISIADELAAGAAANSNDTTVYWRWPFNDSNITNKTDSTDTDLGVEGTAEITVTATITATQVD